MKRSSVGVGLDLGPNPRSEPRPPSERDVLSRSPLHVFVAPHRLWDSPPVRGLLGARCRVRTRRRAPGSRITRRPRRPPDRGSRSLGVSAGEMQAAPPAASPRGEGDRRASDHFRGDGDRWCRRRRLALADVHRSRSGEPGQVLRTRSSRRRTSDVTVSGAAHDHTGQSRDPGRRASTSVFGNNSELAPDGDGDVRAGSDRIIVRRPPRRHRATHFGVGTASVPRRSCEPRRTGRASEVLS